MAWGFFTSSGQEKYSSDSPVITALRRAFRSLASIGVPIPPP